MNRLIFLTILLAATGCVARVGPHGAFIEPLLPQIVIGPPVVVAPPPDIFISPLPPVVVVPDRRLYFYNNFYYYHWDGGWYWSREKRGPWHTLPRDRWPSRMERRDHEHERGGPPAKERRH